MHLSTILPLLLATTTLALPKSCPNNEASAKSSSSSSSSHAVSAAIKANVTAQITKWLSDIESVNTFVDTVGCVTDPALVSSMAATAFVAAQDEGASNTILQQDVALDASGKKAAKALLGQFGIIGPAINDTIFNPGNVQANLDKINGARCPPPQGAGAISQEGEVQAAAAKAVGIKIPPPQTPAACTDAAAQTN